MSSFSKSEFKEWLDHPVTIELRNTLKGLVETAKETLAVDAGTTPLLDKELVGGIAAYRDVLDWNPIKIEESESNDD